MLSLSSINIAYAMNNVLVVYWKNSWKFGIKRTLSLLNLKRLDDGLVLKVKITVWLGTVFASSVLGWLGAG